mgnify:CR=1 FL=1
MIDPRDFVTFSAFIARPKSTPPKRGKMAGKEIKKIVKCIEKFDTIEDVKENGETQKNGLKPEYLDTADCAFKPIRGKRCIHYMAHIKILAKCSAVYSRRDLQNRKSLSNECTVEKVTGAFVQALKLGLESVAIYRKGSISPQPLNTAKRVSFLT